MKSLFIGSSFIFSVIFSSCNEEKGNESLKPISENNPYEVVTPETEVKVTINDYLEEAVSIKSEAEEIITRAEEINCTEAKKIAENVILISVKAEKSSHFLRIEHYIEEASQTLSNAEDAIIYCEEKNEISYITDLQEEQ